MRKFKLLLMTLFSVISFGLMSQTIITTQSSGPNICDGTAVLDTTSLYGNILTWNYQGAQIQVGGYSIDSLCPGTYTFTYIDTTNSFDAVVFTIGYDTTVNYGDTLTVNSSNCVNAIGTLNMTVENCNLNYNAIDTAYLSNAMLLPNSIDSMVTYWVIVDTTGVNTNMVIFYNDSINGVGCYDFTLTVYCYQKSLEYKTLVIKQGFTVDTFVGINELLMNNQRKLMKVTDIMGKETQVESNKILIYCYSDGVMEKVYITE
jgi:hypothetical protein